MLRRSGARHILALYLLDLIALAGALLVARWVRLWIPWGKPLDAPGIALPWGLLPFAIVIWSVALSTARAYDPQRFADAIDEAQTVLAARFVAALLLAGLLYLSYRGISRLFFFYFGILDAAFSLVGRMALRHIAGSGHPLEHRKVLIVGTGPLAQQAARSLASFAWMGLEVVGHLSEDAAHQNAAREDAPRVFAGRDDEGDYAVLGQIGQAAEVVAAQRVQEVIIALSQEDRAMLPGLLQALQHLPVNVKLAPDYAEWALSLSSLERIGDTLLLGVKEPVIGPIERGLKRGLDVVLASLALAAFAPLFAIIALALRLTTRGPVLYRSQRVGEGGRLFRMFKFRTMRPQADTDESALISQTPAGELLFDKRRDDPRITPLGRLVRRTSLDELPQLWNVLRGDMSLVGPRPELPALVERYTPWQRQRLTVPQGITGWWQVSGRSDKHKHAHIEDDIYYIQRYSLLLDLRILWRTLGAVLRGKGAY
jgi:exopolysaccharide biosynthesis polyprenyl glycosylphosphotransferase